MTSQPVLALPPRDPDDDGHGGHDTPQRPETDTCPDWPYFKRRTGPNHLHHANHGWRD